MQFGTESMTYRRSSSTQNNFARGTMHVYNAKVLLTCKVFVAIDIFFSSAVHLYVIFWAQTWNFVWLLYSFHSLHKRFRRWIFQVDTYFHAFFRINWADMASLHEWCTFT